MTQFEPLGPENAIWDDGEWISWTSIDSHLERLELKARYPGADVDLIPLLDEMISFAEGFYHRIGRHSQIYGDIGEIFGAAVFGIKLNKTYAQGSDGRLGDDFVEIKTITPFKSRDTVTIRLDRHFSKLLVVKISEDFELSGILVDRKKLPQVKGKFLIVTWDQVSRINGARQSSFDGVMYSR